MYKIHMVRASFALLNIKAPERKMLAVLYTPSELFNLYHTLPVEVEISEASVICDEDDFWRRAEKKLLPNCISSLLPG